MKYIIIFIITIFLLFQCAGRSTKFSNGYSYDSGFNLEGHGGWLYKDRINKKTTVVDTIIIEYRVVGDFFVGIGMPAEMVDFTCRHDDGISEGFYYAVVNETDIFILDFNSGKQDHLTSFNELYEKLQKYNVKIEPFDQDNFTKGKDLFLSLYNVNMKIPEYCFIDKL